METIHIALLAFVICAVSAVLFYGLFFREKKPKAATNGDEIDAKLGIIQLPPIRVSEDTYDLVKAHADRGNVIVQAFVRNMLDELPTPSYDVPVQGSLHYEATIKVRFRAMDADMAKDVAYEIGQRLRKDAELFGVPVSPLIKSSTQQVDGSF